MRIASLSPAATEILFMLGLEKNVVCRDQFSNFPGEAKSIPRVKGHQEIDVEDVKKFLPEVVLTGTVIQQKLAEELLGQDFAVIHQDPRTIHQIYESIRQLGVIFEKVPEAEELILKMQQGFNAVTKRSSVMRVGAQHAAPLRTNPNSTVGALHPSTSSGQVATPPHRPRVYVEEWHLPPMVSGNWVPEIIRIAGGQSFPIKDGELSHEVTLDQVAAFNPDLIVISWCGAGNLADKEILLKREGWGNLRAVQSGHVRVIDDSLLNRPGPRLVEGAQRIYGWLFEQLHE